MTIRPNKRPARILEALESSDEPLTASEIAEATGDPIYLVSDTLCDLRDKGLVVIERNIQPRTFSSVRMVTFPDLPPPVEFRALVAVI